MQFRKHLTEVYTNNLYNVTTDIEKSIWNEIIYAVMNRNLMTLEFYLYKRDQKFLKRIVDTKNYNIFILACQNDQSAVIKWLLANGVFTVETVDFDNRNGFVNAAMYRCTKAMRYRDFRHSSNCFTCV